LKLISAQSLDKQTVPFCKLKWIIFFAEINIQRATGSVIPNYRIRMPYRNYNTRGPTNNPNVAAPSAALNPAKPIPPSGAKPFPPPSNNTITNQPSDSSLASVVDDTSMDDVSGKSDLNKTKDGKITKKQKWSKSDKKNYINIRLRRMISPKSPVQILEELVQQEQSDMSYNFLEPVTEGGLQFFTCEVTVSGALFTGTGPSKPIAKNIAAEGAIHAFITNSVQSANPNPDAEDIADNAPWKALASLGLFKLFNDWQSQGYSLPQQFMSTPSTVPKSMGVSQLSEANPSSQSNFIQKAAKMPEDPTSKHPVMLLNELYPEAAFEGSLGVVPGGMFSMTVEIQGRSFQGTGRSKKDAKKACAISALKSLHDLQYSQA